MLDVPEIALGCGRESEQLEELLAAKTGLLQDREEGAALERSAVERDGDDARAVGVPVVVVRAGGVVSAGCLQPLAGGVEPSLRRRSDGARSPRGRWPQA